ncbi:phosphoribosyl 1,2-cyclic phosphate phosphodiesterase [Geoalkalibacter ferrihydriticus]|uniref:Beta-lactamase n=2 Tax=Geoalkalibacter ferrihydriticus TaxID=392333 RepID=A0A0C2EGS5_9BACT|nr:GPMC system MBL fold metallohydrolase [Geoalkalibacter ferrihydriticus]KIH77853.1 beta-lactamase [Geoalkalibacter ferrihydriticus DSM 17813]SDL82709.1 phosphoribosyl 1,2-cyclic phosphate phosphodiesterase [Geoalkalibacter ferrihydriticus]
MNTRHLDIIVLGSGTSTGVPTLGCSCAVCTSNIAENQRTRCSLLLRTGDCNILIDSATDLRQQALREGIDHLDAVLYTHTHADHVNGIDDLRAFNMKGGPAIPIFGDAETIAGIQRVFAYIFDDNLAPGYRPRLNPQVISGPVSLCGLPIAPVPLQHGEGRSLGFRVGPFAYLTDCSAIPETSRPLLAGVHTAIIDGLRFRPHNTHFNIPQAVAAMKEMQVKRIILTHLSHDIDHHRDSQNLPSGVEFAFDGQRISFAF